MGHRSSATARRAQLRRGATARRLALVAGCFLKLVKALQHADAGFGHFVNPCLDGHAVLGGWQHCGDLLAIPPVEMVTLSMAFPAGGLSTCDMARLVNFTLSGLNFLYGGARALRIPGTATAVQRSAQLRIATKW